MATEQTNVKVICRLRPVNSTEIENWRKDRLYQVLKSGGLQELSNKFKRKNKKYQDPQRWRSIVNDEKKLKLDFGMSPNDILKFQKLVAKSDFSDWDSEERLLAENICVDLFQENHIRVIDPKDREFEYHFDDLLHWDVGQEETFDTIALPILQAALQGISGTLLAYGQTGSGKTYTMFGKEPIAKCPQDEYGVVQRSFSWLFNELEMDETVEDVKVHVEAVEVYMGKLRDLLQPTIKNKEKRLKLLNCDDKIEGLEEEEEEDRRRSTIKKKKSNKKKKKKKKKDEVNVKGSKVYTKIDGCFEAVATTMRDLKRLISKAWKNRSTETTAKNSVSSRSHMVLRTKLVIKKTDGSYLQSRLTFGDLAGSEKTKNSKVVGRQMKQAQDINKQLFVLRQCMDAILTKQNRIPYANALLTRVLEHCIGGQTKLCIVANCSPHASCLVETCSTLQFAQQCRQLECHVESQTFVARDDLESRLAAAEAEKIELRRMLTHTNRSVSVDDEQLQSLQFQLAETKRQLNDSNNKLTVTNKQLENVQYELSISQEHLRSLSTTRMTPLSNSGVPEFYMASPVEERNRSRRNSFASSCASESCPSCCDMELQNSCLKKCLHETGEEYEAVLKKFEQQKDLIAKLNTQNQHLQMISDCSDELLRKQDEQVQSISESEQETKIKLKEKEDEVKYLKAQNSALTKRIQELEANDSRVEECGSPRPGMLIGGNTQKSSSSKSPVKKEDLAKLFTLLDQKNSALNRMKQETSKLQKRLAKFKTEQFARSVHRKRSLESRVPLSYLDDNINEVFYGHRINRSLSPEDENRSSCTESGSRSNSLSITLEKQSSLLKDMAQIIMSQQNTAENIPTENMDDLEVLEEFVGRAKQQLTEVSDNVNNQYEHNFTGPPELIGYSPHCNFAEFVNDITE